MAAFIVGWPEGFPLDATRAGLRRIPLQIRLRATALQAGSQNRQLETHPAEQPVLRRKVRWFVRFEGSRLGAPACPRVQHIRWLSDPPPPLSCAQNVSKHAIAVTASSKTNSSPGSLGSGPTRNRVLRSQPACLRNMVRPGRPPQAEDLPHTYCAKASTGACTSCLCLHSPFGHCSTGPAFSHFSTMYGLPHSGHFSCTGLPQVTKLQSGQRLQP